MSLTRRLRGRTSLEVAVDRSRTGTGFSKSARDAFAAARSSYEAIFQTMASFIDGDGGAAHVSADGIDARPFEWQVTGALRVDLRSSGRFPLYLTAGGGFARSDGDAAQVTLVNEYSFNPVNVRSGLHNTFDEIDRIVVHARSPALRALVTLGAGTSRRLSQRSGIELDVRASISRPSVVVTVDASPHVALVANDPDSQRSGIFGFSGSEMTPSMTDPVTVMLFDSNQALFSTYPSSLSGPAVSDLQTFSGHGLQVNTTFRAGIYYRF